LLILSGRSAGLSAQGLTQVIKGIVVDRETGIPLSGANVSVSCQGNLTGSITALDGSFSVLTGVGRAIVKVSYIGYEETTFMDILVGTGKEIDLVIEMKEKVVETKEVVVTTGRSRYSSLNSMATVSATTLRSADALRFAGGHYDPSRMINSFAGVSTANSDETNEVIIRGNSPRGVLWRLEGIEIPNPNHFSTGQGGSGGAYSVASSNVLTSFGFYTGAFPAEFGNALSGVMDMDLRKGNNERREYAFQTGMLGAEVSAEGPFSGKSSASYLINARYVNFGILSSFNLIDLGMLNIPPNTSDIVSNINIPAGKAGTFNFFTLYGISRSGRRAPHDTSLWQSPSDNYEESDHEDLFIIGLKHFTPLSDNKTYFRTTIAYTYQSEIYSEGNLDSSFYRHVTYKHDYRYPAFRGSFSMNHKFNAIHSLKVGMNYNQLYGNMLYFRLNSENLPDTIVNSRAVTSLTQIYSQWKYKVSNRLEFNSGVHAMHFGLSGEWSLEPRLG